MKTEYKRYLQYIPGVRFWIIATGMIIVLAAMKQASYFINIFLLSLFLNIISIGPLEWMKKKGLREYLAISVLIASFLIIVSLTLLIIGSSVNNFISKMPVYTEKFNELWAITHHWLVQQGIVDKDFKPLKELNPGNILPVAGNFFAGFGNVMGTFFLVFIIYIFMLFETSIFAKKMKILFPGSKSDMENLIKNLVKYFGIKTLTSLATGISISIGLLILGVDFPILWGFLAFILNFIPSVGSFIAAIPAVLIALLLNGPLNALITIAMYFVLNTLIGNIIEPPLMGKNLGISPLFVFIAMIFWGYILGPVGMLIATPLVIIIKMALDSRPVTENIGAFLGNEAALDDFVNIRKDRNSKV